jgi:hypothetical protein
VLYDASAGCICYPKAVLLGGTHQFFLRLRAPLSVVNVR